MQIKTKNKLNLRFKLINLKILILDSHKYILIIYKIFMWKNFNYLDLFKLFKNNFNYF
jgi:hypothetical protein